MDDNMVKPRSSTVWKRIKVCSELLTYLCVNPTNRRNHLSVFPDKIASKNSGDNDVHAEYSKLKLLKP